MERFDAGKLEEQLQKLPPWKQVAFIALTGARTIGNYDRFSDNTGFGDVAVLRRALDAVWSWVESGTLPYDLGALRNSCDDQAPDTTQHRSIYTSAALDAATIAATALDAIARPSEVRGSEVASLARDSIDLFVQETLRLDPQSARFEDAIGRHDLMQRELRRQQEDLAALVRLPDDRAAAARELRATALERLGSLE